MNSQLVEEMREGRLSISQGMDAARAISSWHEYDHPLLPDGRPDLGENNKLPQCKYCHGVPGGHKMSCSVMKRRNAIDLDA